MSGVGWAQKAAIKLEQHVHEEVGQKHLQHTCALRVEANKYSSDSITPYCRRQVHFGSK